MTARPAVRLGMIGYGAIGKHVEAALKAGGIENLELVSALVKRPRTGGLLTHEPDRFFVHDFDAVAECAGHEAVRAYGQRVLESGADFFVTSVGAFTDTALFERLLAAAKASGARLILPSGGIGALDILSSAAVGGLDSVTVTVRKDPSAWKGTVAETLVDLDGLTAPHTVFDGPVREGARLYPQNVNISAAAAIAGLGLDRTRVVIVADPTITTHIVELEAKGAFGRFTFMEDVTVSEENRKTGKLVAMAMVKSVRQLASTLVVAA
ncbi:aspartate dehydrogenase [Reyranella sp.]|uniref:aspartate dehydrogenase n=1 Tax=Reyranella sp. TaxID=1929291 RepID=UPI0025D1650C|nr:aspartate dehydrogenase [Reyranella sp.]